jgi:hypothetical protein
MVEIYLNPTEFQQVLTLVRAWRQTPQGQLTINLDNLHLTFGRLQLFGFSIANDRVLICTTTYLIDIRCRQNLGPTLP